MRSLLLPLLCACAVVVIIVACFMMLGDSAQRSYVAPEKLADTVTAKPPMSATPLAADDLTPPADDLSASRSVHARQSLAPPDRILRMRMLLPGAGAPLGLQVVLLDESTGAERSRFAVNRYSMARPDRLAAARGDWTMEGAASVLRVELDQLEDAPGRIVVFVTNAETHCAEIPGVRPTRPHEAQDPRLDPIDLRESLHVVDAIVTDDAGYRIGGAVVRVHSGTAAGFITATDRWGEISLATGDARLSLVIEAAGFRAQRFDGVGPNATLVLLRGIAVKLVATGLPELAESQRVGVWFAPVLDPASATETLRSDWARRSSHPFVRDEGLPSPDFAELDERGRAELVVSGPGEREIRVGIVGGGVELGPADARGARRQRVFAESARAAPVRITIDAKDDGRVVNLQLSPADFEPPQPAWPMNRTVPSGAGSEGRRIPSDGKPPKQD